MMNANTETYALSDGARIATGLVRTVLGDTAPARLGRVNYHEHLFQTTPLLPGEELNDEVRSRDEAASMRDAGIDAMIDATPWGLGRDPSAVARISHATGMQVVATAGFHREAHYPDSKEALSLTVTEIAARCIRELTVGQPLTDASPNATCAGAEPADDSYAGNIALGPEGVPVRAGILKVGIGYWAITAFENRVIEGVAAAHRTTGAPVMVHLEHGTCAHEALDRLGDCGVAADSVVLAHIDRSPDPILYGEIAERGAYLGCDGAARLKDHPEATLIAAIAGACEAGHAARIVLGGDVARRSRYLAYGGMPGIAYLTNRFTPRLTSHVGKDTVHTFLTSNAQRLLTWQPPG